MADNESSPTEHDATSSAIDAAFRLGIAPDGQTAFLTHLRPPEGGGRPLAAEAVLAALTQRKVTHGIDRERIAAIVAAVNAGTLDNLPPDSTPDADAPGEARYVIARGEPPEDGSDGVLQWRVDAKPEAGVCVVLPGETVAVHSPATQGKPGEDVYGKVAAARNGRDDLLKAGPGIEVVNDQGRDEYRAQWLGVVVLQDREIEIDPRIEIGEDGMQASMDVFARSASGKDVEIAQVLAILETQGVRYGVDTAVIERALQQARSDPSGCVAQVVVARGTSPKEGKDARLGIRHAENIVGQDLSMGRIDFHERNYPWNVHQGETIGYLLDARPGEPGKAVTGKAIEVVEPRRIEVELVGVHRDEHGKLIADLDGALIIEGKRLSVVDLIEVDRDVGPETGNVHSNTAVHVKGHVAPGYVLESGKSVIVDQNVEDATLRAGGEVVIKGGIRGRRSGVFAPGDVHVGYIENAAVYVNGNVTVLGSVINSDVACNGNIVIGDKRTKRGAVIGGALTASLVIEAMTLGSPSYARTQVSVGLSQETRRQINKLRDDVSGKAREIERLTQLANHYARQPTGNTQLLPKIKATREALLAELGELKQRERELLASLKEAEKSKVVVYRLVHPGVVVNINERLYEVKQELGPGRFTLVDDAVAFQPGV